MDIVLTGLYTVVIECSTNHDDEPSVEHVVMPDGSKGIGINCSNFVDCTKKLELNVPRDMMFYWNRLSVLYLQASRIPRMNFQKTLKKRIERCFPESHLK